MGWKLYNGRIIGDSWEDAMILARFCARTRGGRFRVHGIRINGKWSYITTEVLPEVLP